MPAPATPNPMSLFAPVGDSGLKGYGGFITEEFLPELSGARGLRVFNRMANNDATIGAILHAFETLITNIEWTVQAADDTPKAEEAKKFIEGVLDDMDTPLADVVSEACTMFAFGFAPMEIIFKRRQGARPTEGVRSKFSDGRIGVRSIELRAQTSLINWDLDPTNGAIRAMNQLGTWKGTVRIPREKMALFRTRSVKNNPEGGSVLRRAYRAWYFKSKLEEIEAVGIERNNAGLPVIRIPSRYLLPEADSAEKAFVAEMTRIGARIRKDQQDCVVVASDVDATTGRPLIDIALLTPAGTTFDAGSVIQRYDRAMATAVLMDWLFLGQGSVGSWSLADTKTSLSAQSTGTFARRIAQIFTTDVIGRLWELNGMDPAVMPKLHAGDIEKQDIGQISSMVSTLVAAGDVMGRDEHNFLRKTIGMPLAPEEGMGPQGVPGMPERAQPGEDWKLADEPPRGAKS